MKKLAILLAVILSIMAFAPALEMTTSAMANKSFKSSFTYSNC